MEHFGAVLELDLTLETRTQLQEEEAIASYLILATPDCYHHLSVKFWQNKYSSFFLLLVKPLNTVFTV